MVGNKTDLTQVIRVVNSLENITKTQNSADFLSILQNIPEKLASDLTRGILSIPAFLDDSVSNRALGSIFDRTSDTPINRMLRRIAEVYGVAESIAGTTGTTGLNVPAVMTLAKENEGVLVSRDCHVSVIGGLYLSGAKPIYLIPPFHQELGVLLPPSVEEIREILELNSEIQGIVLTMPTYHGLMGNVNAIVAECHARGKIVMVDEAHGPHLHFLSGLNFPIAAEDAGADLVTQSTHKVLSALNQGSLLHFNNPHLLREYEKYQAMGFQSTSFSYPILLSIEQAIDQMVTSGEVLWSHAKELAIWFRERLSFLPGIKIIDEEIIDGHRVIGLDQTRVTINVRDTCYSGYQIEDYLFSRGIIVEMATSDVVLFLISPSVSGKQLNFTLNALKKLIRKRVYENQTEVFKPPSIPTQVFSPRQTIMLTKRKRIPKDQAIGLISGETIGCYPPGQAIFVAGERITEEGIDYLTRAVKAGGHLKRVQDDHFRTIEVINE